jgi:hypothetical protein
LATKAVDDGSIFIPSLHRRTHINSGGENKLSFAFSEKLSPTFGKTSDCAKCVEKADSAKMAKLIKLVGMLLQTKTYLFWS